MRLNDTPEWQALRAALTSLVDATSAVDAYVIDVWSDVWCLGHGDSYERELELIDPVVARLAAVEPSLARGGRFDGMMAIDTRRLYVRSFASVYAVMLTFEGDPDMFSVRKAVGLALPKIEALTCSLPPPDGPGAGGAQGFGVA